MDGLKRGSAAIVGVAESDLGEVADGMSVIDLMAQGAKRALDDCGLSLKDVDGLFSATTQSRLSVLALAEYLGVKPLFLGSTIVGGSSFEYHVAHAMGAIGLGLCNVAVIAYGSISLPNLIIPSRCNKLIFNNSACMFANLQFLRCYLPNHSYRKTRAWEWVTIEKISRHC